MNLERALEKVMKDPEKRVKLYIAFNIGLFLVNLGIIMGIIILFVHFAGLI